MGPYLSYKVSKTRSVSNQMNGSYKSPYRNSILNYGQICYIQILRKMCDLFEFSISLRSTYTQFAEHSWETLLWTLEDKGRAIFLHVENRLLRDKTSHPRQRNPSPTCMKFKSIYNNFLINC